MHILFKRHGQNRLFKRFESVNELNDEIKKGHNDKFPGNNQFCFDTLSNEFRILNSRLSLIDCQEQLNLSKCLEQLKPASDYDHPNSS